MKKGINFMRVFLPLILLTVSCSEPQMKAPCSKANISELVELIETGCSNLQFRRECSVLRAQLRQHKSMCSKRR